jgi:hypothetical protein
MTYAQTQKRKRYVVTIKGKVLEEQTVIVIIANSPENMRAMAEKLFRNEIYDNNGIPRADITYVESELL